MTNIFVDASVHGFKNGKFISCSCACLVNESCNDQNIDKLPKITKILNNSTNNIGELEAIFIGIELGESLCLPGDIINIYSDSKISVFSLREWISKWTLTDDGYLLNKSKPIKNPGFLKKIIYKIVNSKNQIHLYHLPGHVNINNKMEIENAYNYFLSMNMIPLKSIKNNIGGYNIIKYQELSPITLFYNNNMVDNISRTVLSDYINKRMNIQVANACNIFERVISYSDIEY